MGTPETDKKITDGGTKIKDLADLKIAFAELRNQHYKLEAEVTILKEDLAETVKENMRYS